MKSGSAALRDLLPGTPLADAVPETALLARFSRRVLQPGTLIQEEGTTDGRFGVVAEGTLLASRRVTGVRDLPVFFLKRGDYFGFLPLLDGGRCPLTVVTRTKAVLYLLERHLFQLFLREKPEFCSTLLAALASRFRECLDQIGMLGKPGALARVAAALSEELPQKAAKGTLIGWPMRQTQLAEALGIAPENLSRAVARLERLGILHRESRHMLRIDDPIRLRAAAERMLPELDDHQ